MPELQKRINELNTKAYYLLVAQSFLMTIHTGSGWLKVALTLTALVAVLPVQDYTKTDRWLSWIRWGKVFALSLAFVATLLGVWERTYYRAC